MIRVFSLREGKMTTSDTHSTSAKKNIFITNPYFLLGLLFAIWWFYCVAWREHLLADIHDISVRTAYIVLTLIIFITWVILLIYIPMQFYKKETNPQIEHDQPNTPPIATKEDTWITNPYFWIGLVLFIWWFFCIGWRDVILKEVTSPFLKTLFSILSRLIFVWWLILTIYIAKLYYKKTTEPRKKNDIVDPKTGIQWLRFDNIPREFINHDFDKIHEISYRLFDQNAIWTIRTIYIHTLDKGLKNSYHTSNKCLIIEHSFPTIEQRIESYIHIKGDWRDWPLIHIRYFLVWPLTLFFLLFVLPSKGDILAAYTSWNEYLSSYNLNTGVFFICLFFFTGYISYLIKKYYAYRHAIIIENRLFEKWFDVDSNDPIIARQICNPGFIEKIDIWLQKHNLKTCIELYIDFKQNRILCKFDYMNTRVQPNLSESYVQQQIQLSWQYIEDLHLPEDMQRILLSHPQTNTPSSI